MASKPSESGMSFCSECGSGHKNLGRLCSRCEHIDLMKQAMTQSEESLQEIKRDVVAPARGMPGLADLEAQLDRIFDEIRSLHQEGLKLMIEVGPGQEACFELAGKVMFKIAQVQGILDQIQQINVSRN